VIAGLARRFEDLLAGVLGWCAKRLLPPLRIPASPNEDAALLVLRQVRAENRFFVSVAVWFEVSLLLILLDLSDGSGEAWSPIPVSIWGMALAIHGFRTVKRRHARFLVQHRAAVAADAGAARVDDDGDDLRGKLSSSAEEAREALRSISPETLPEVSRGETRALKLMAWLGDAEKLPASTRCDRELRRDTVTRLAETGGEKLDRQPLEDLLRELDAHEQRLATVEQRARDRRERLESFLLALEGVRVAAAGGVRDPAALTAPLRERVAVLAESGRDGTAAVRRAETDGAARRFREEVRLAQDLQRSILPSAAPRVAGLTVAHLYRPSNEVGGDFYDFYDRGRGRLLVAVGDASGHGIDSSMVSSMAKSAVYMQLAQDRGGNSDGLADAMAQINRMMCDTLGRRRMMTLTLMEVDAAGRRIRWVNAGHVYPLLRRGGEVRDLEQPGYPLGVRREMVYRVGEEALEPGDLLLLLTDGYVEALDPGGEPLGWEPLTERLRGSRSTAVDALLRELTEDLESHLQGASPQDDVTLIALGYQP
jgi:serine phosphatase RsbU (regulator of sigma subunit)